MLYVVLVILIMSVITAEALDIFRSAVSFHSVCIFIFVCVCV